MVLTVPVKGYFAENCYLYVSENTRHSFIIDPGAQADKLLAVIRDNGLIIEKILLTHGHFDHFGAVEELREKLNCPVLAHEKAGLFLLKRSYQNSNNELKQVPFRYKAYNKKGDTSPIV